MKWSVLLLIFSVAAGVRAQTVDLDKTFRTLGFKVTGRTNVAAADWELRDFKMRSKRIFALKSLKKVPGERNLYYRFAVRIEEYENEADAERRIAEIEATPPGADSKLTAPEYDLREGFRRGTRVYVVSTNVYKFVADKSLSRFKSDLEKIVKE
ncbi:MAG: hypothetical protein JSS81_13780 [Acidobacteria bacterium]|nr:hypothetical protein [Acidobacteriota bacterium]